MRYLRLTSHILPWLIAIMAAAYADGFPSGQSPPGSPSQGCVVEIVVGGVAIPVSISNPLPTSTQ
jgi:hypothetical protein